VLSAGKISRRSLVEGSVRAPPHRPRPMSPTSYSRDAARSRGFRPPRESISGFPIGSARNRFHRSCEPTGRLRPGVQCEYPVFEGAGVPSRGCSSWPAWTSARVRLHAPLLLGFGRRRFRRCSRRGEPTFAGRERHEGHGQKAAVYTELTGHDPWENTQAPTSRVGESSSHVLARHVGMASISEDRRRRRPLINMARRP